MNLVRSLVVSALFLLIAVAGAGYLYPSLPEQIPTHWGLHGQINGYHSRLWAAVFPAAMIMLLEALASLLPLLSARGFRIGQFAPVWYLAMLIVQALVLVVGLAVLLHGAGHAIAVPKVAMFGAGALFMVIGNYMGKLRKNFFIGIRTPWTLTSDAVWERTHRLAGRLMVPAGLLIMIGSVFGMPLYFLVVLLVGSTGVPYLYSLVIYRRLEKR